MKKKNQVKKYWNSTVHDGNIAKAPVGSLKFFDNIYKYHFTKQDYMTKLINYPQYKGKKVLGVGCGIGIDLLRFAKNGAKVVGVDFAPYPVQLAKKNFKLHKKKGTFLVMDAENLEFKDNMFDAVFMHGVLPYAPNPQKMVDEAYRVLKPGGKVLIAVYHRRGWMYYLSKLTGTPLEHEHAPCFKMFTFKEVKKLFKKYSSLHVWGERFPKPTKLHKGVKGMVYNQVFIPLMNLIPRKILRPIGWHIVGEAIK